MLVGIVYGSPHILAINEAYFEHSRPLCGVSYDDDDGDEAIQSAALWQQRQRPPQLELTKRRPTAAPTAQLQRHSTLLAACCKANALTAPAANAATARPELEPEPQAEAEPELVLFVVVVAALVLFTFWSCISAVRRANGKCAAHECIVQCNNCMCTYGHTHVQYRHTHTHTHTHTELASCGLMYAKEAYKAQISHLYNELELSASLRSGRRGVTKKGLNNSHNRYIKGMR